MSVKASVCYVNELTRNNNNNKNFFTAAFNVGRIANKAACLPALMRSPDSDQLPHYFSKTGFYYPGRLPASKALARLVRLSGSQSFR